MVLTVFSGDILAHLVSPHLSVTRLQCCSRVGVVSFALAKATKPRESTSPALVGCKFSFTITRNNCLQPLKAVLVCHCDAALACFAQVKTKITPAIQLRYFTVVVPVFASRTLAIQVEPWFMFAFVKIVSSDSVFSRW